MTAKQIEKAKEYVHSNVYYVVAKREDGTEYAKEVSNVTIEQAFTDGYNKANEWHYPSKGEYPKDEKEVLVYMWGSFYIGSYKQYTDDNNAWHFNDFDEESEQITAWKEIVLPKEVKENDSDYK